MLAKSFAMFIDAIKFITGKIITSFFLVLIANKDKSNAEVPLVQVNANFDPTYLANISSNFLTIGPEVK